MPNVFSIIYPNYDEKFDERFVDWLENNVDCFFVFYIEPRSFDEIHSFIINTIKYPHKVFFNMDEKNLILDKHLSNYIYFKQFGFDVEKVVFLRQDFLPLPPFNKMIQSTKTGLVWWNKNNYLNENIAVQWFSPELLETIIEHLDFLEVDLDVDVDIQNDIIKKRLRKKNLSYHEGDCKSMDCLRPFYLKPH